MLHMCTPDDLFPHLSRLTLAGAVAAALFVVRPLDSLFHFPLNQLVGIGYIASSLTLLALAASINMTNRNAWHKVLLHIQCKLAGL